MTNTRILIRKVAGSSKLFEEDKMETDKILVVVLVIGLFITVIVLGFDVFGMRRKQTLALIEICRYFVVTRWSLVPYKQVIDEITERIEKDEGKLRSRIAVETMLRQLIVLGVLEEGRHRLDSPLCLSLANKK